MSKVEQLRKSFVESFANLFNDTEIKVEFKYREYDGKMIKFAFNSVQTMVPVKIKVKKIDKAYRFITFVISFEEHEVEIITYTSIHFGAEKLCSCLSDKIEIVINETLKNDWARIHKEYNLLNKIFKNKK